MNNERLILDAINRVHFDVLALKADVTKVTDDHEERIRAAEQTITRYKTIGSLAMAVVSYIGFDVLWKQWPRIGKP